MNRKNLVIFFATVLFLIGACSLPSRISQTASPTPNPQGGLSQTPPPTGNEPQGGSQTDIQATFPVAPDSQMKSPDNYDPTDPSGSFTILSQANIDTLVKYYADELPTQGWTSRYTDANFTGGVTQYWKKDNVYLSMEFGYEEGQVTIHCQFNRVDPQAAQKLPKDFPLPGQFEMVEAEETSWEVVHSSRLYRCNEVLHSKIVCTKLETGSYAGTNARQLRRQRLWRKCNLSGRSLAHCDDRPQTNQPAFIHNAGWECS